jgi:hypothetical protein
MKAALLLHSAGSQPYALSVLNVCGCAAWWGGGGPSARPGSGPHPGLAPFTRWAASTAPGTGTTRSPEGTPPALRHHAALPRPYALPPPPARQRTCAVYSRRSLASATLAALPR